MGNLPTTFQANIDIVDPPAYLGNGVSTLNNFRIIFNFRPDFIMPGQMAAFQVNYGNFSGPLPSTIDITSTIQRTSPNITTISVTVNGVTNTCVFPKGDTDILYFGLNVVNRTSSLITINGAKYPASGLLTSTPNSAYVQYLKKNV
jgi:hypothetical protein